MKDIVLDEIFKKQKDGAPNSHIFFFLGRKLDGTIEVLKFFRNDDYFQSRWKYNQKWSKEQPNGIPCFDEISPM